jgi:acetoacetyl-CoA synthetase
MTDTNGTVIKNGIVTTSTKLWEHPSPKSTKMYEIMTMLNDTKGLDLKTYDDLHEWSINNIATFWELVWHFTGIRSSVPFRQVCGDFKIPRRR